MGFIPLVDFGPAASLDPGLELRRGAGRSQGVVYRAGVLALRPRLITVRLETFDKRVHGDLHHVFAARALWKRDQMNWVTKGRS